MIKSKHDSYLINNTFEPDEAKELLTQLINEKLVFVKERIFTLEEKFGITSSSLNKRLAELNNAINEVNAFLDGIDEEEMDIIVRCPIHMEAVPSKMSKKTTST